MFSTQGEEKNKPLSDKKGELKNKEVIAEYDEALKNEESGAKSSNKLDYLREKLGLGGGKKEGGVGVKTNLIDDDVATFIDWETTLSLFVSYLIIIIFLIVGAYAFLTFLENEEEKKADIFEESIGSLKIAIAEQEKRVEKGLDLQEKIEAFEGLLDKHVYWTRFFEYLEDNTIDLVSYQNFSGKTDGKYALKATADAAYFTATEQLRVFRESPYTKSVQISELSMSEQEDGTKLVNFTINLEVNQDIFYDKKDEQQ